MGMEGRGVERGERVCVCACMWGGGEEKKWGRERDIKTLREFLEIVRVCLKIDR